MLEHCQDRLRALEEAQDWPGLAKAYYEMGCAAMDQGQLHRAALWLHRADTIYSSQDEIYEAVGDQLIDDCSDRIGQLEDEPLLYNQIPEQIEQAAEEMDDLQLRLWGLLSISRLVPLMNQLSRLPGRQALDQLGWITDVILRSFQAPLTQDQFDLLSHYCNAFYNLTDSELFYAGGQIETPEGPPFQMFDLNGMMGTYLELTNYLDNHLRWLTAEAGQELPAETGAVSCALPLDYYVRVSDQPLDQLPPLQAELDRIWDDFRFLQSGPAWAQAGQRMAEYSRRS